MMHIHFDFHDNDRQDGMIIDRRPPYRSEGPGKGTYIGIISQTTPAYAEVFEDGGSGPIWHRAIPASRVAAATRFNRSHVKPRGVLIGLKTIRDDATSTVTWSRTFCACSHNPTENFRRFLNYAESISRRWPTEPWRSVRTASISRDDFTSYDRKLVYHTIHSFQVKELIFLIIAVFGHPEEMTDSVIKTRLILH